MDGSDENYHVSLAEFRTARARVFTRIEDVILGLSKRSFDEIKSLADAGKLTSGQNRELLNLAVSQADRAKTNGGSRDYEIIEKIDSDHHLWRLKGNSDNNAKQENRFGHIWLPPTLDDQRRLQILSVESQPQSDIVKLKVYGPKELNAIIELLAGREKSGSFIDSEPSFLRALSELVNPAPPTPQTVTGNRGHALTRVPEFA